MKTIRQSKVIRTCKGACRVGDIVIFDVLGAAPRGSGATEAAARDAVAVVDGVEDGEATPIAHGTVSVSASAASR